MSSKEHNGESRNCPPLNVLAAYLANYEPDSSGRSLKTTEAIVRELEDMVEVDPSDVVQALTERGFGIVWQPNGRHGWAMRLRGNRPL